MVSRPSMIVCIFLAEPANKEPSILKIDPIMPKVFGSQMLNNLLTTGTNATLVKT